MLVDFSAGPQGWTAGFADYPAGQERAFRLEASYRPLPSPLEGSGSALYISGANGSDDLFMFWKGRVGGLEPGRTYAARFQVEIATDAPGGCAGVGGSPGEGVYVKAGASAVVPEAENVGGYYRMNVDKGEQSRGGADAVVLGDIANSRPCGDERAWELKSLSGGGALEATADGEGSLWLFMGTDSGFEGTTSLYYTQIRVLLD